MKRERKGFWEDAYFWTVIKLHTAQETITNFNTHTDTTVII